MNFDASEQEVEYDRLCAALTGEGADELVTRLHAGQSQIGNGSKLVHLYAVSELAAEQANTFYFESDFSVQRYHRLACKLGGLLHESIDWGATFEEVVAVSDEITARSVAALTADRRLARPKRIELLVNQIGLAGDLAQLVKLADLRHTCFHLRSLKPAKLHENDLYHIDAWVGEAREVLPILDKLNWSPLAACLTGLRTEIAAIAEQCHAAWRRTYRRKR